MKYKRSIKKDKNTISPEQAPPTPPTLPSSALYHSTIVDCPLYKFIEVSTTGNYSALIISGFPTETQLIEAWGRIIGEYSEAIGDNEHKLYLSLYREINRLQITLEQVHILVSMLEKVYCGAFVTELNQLLRSTFIFDVHNPEQYNKTLKTVISKSKSFKISHDLKLAQFEAIRVKMEEGQGVSTKEYFLSVLITLSDHAKYPLTDHISTYEYCERIKRLNQHIAQMEKK